MLKIKEKLKNINIPINSGSLALFISLLAVGYVASAVQSPCIQAQATCAVGGDSEFSGNIGLKGGTTYVATLDASGISADRTITIPNADGTILLGGGLGASKVVATDISGDLTTTSVYPLSIGTSGQVLTVDATNTFLEYSAITGVPILTSSKSVSTDGAGALTTNDVYPLSLVASKVAKTDVSGNLTTGQIDITTDVIAGNSLQQIRSNAGGTALEYFTPSGGGDYTLLDSGAITNPTGNSDEFLICWGGGTLDATKTYKLIIWGGDGNHGNGTYYPYLRPGKNDCTTGTRTEWDSSANGNYASSFVGRILSFSLFNSQDVDLCPLVQGANANSSTTYSLNVGGELNLRANGSQLTYQTDRGIRIQGEMMGEVMHSGGNGGLQRGDIFCNWNNDLLFSNITHFYGNLNVDNMGTNTTHNAEWALYETGSQ